MKKTLIIILFLLSSSKILHAQWSFDPKTRALQIIELFRNEEYSQAYTQLNDSMRRMIDEEQLGAVWDGIVMRYDSVLEIGGTEVIDLDSMVVTITALRFAKLKIGFKLTFNKQGEICGLFMVPVNYAYQPASYVNTTKFYEIKKNVPDPQYPSEGVLTIPNGNKKFPLVIIVGGSGATDKDFTQGPNKTGKDLAWGIAAKGIAVYRYDKRSLQFGLAMFQNKNLTVDDEYLYDLKAVVKMLSNYDKIDKNNIYVLGHSEGAYLIPYFAKNISGIKGFISASGPYSDFITLVEQQYKYLASKAATAEERADIISGMPAIEYAKHHLSKESPADSMPFHLPASYLLHLNSNAPGKHISKVKNKPLLFIQGGRDYQVPPAELDKWKAALGNHQNVEYKIYPSLNHMLHSGKGDSLPAEYNKQGNVPEEVVNDIAKWVVKQSG